MTKAIANRFRGVLEKCIDKEQSASVPGRLISDNTYVQEVMRKMGFDPNWIDSIMKCVSTVSYSVVLNRQAGDIFHPTRGLRQGDPLSLFLFLICGEGLSSLMRLTHQEEHFKGVKASRRGPQISHLLFADDCILFGEATEREAGLLKFFYANIETVRGNKLILISLRFSLALTPEKKKRD
ncbi:reverse transcriptase [Gossypium australe]|uniref:Reverse transcriptase n=1 Tax=Gossypium australe TaxID=47621 RepID=A0A5B6W1B6_9ROSI|nr:reverse transcriptase [Gossypium australe]